MTIAEERRKKAAIELAEAVVDGKTTVNLIAAYREAREEVRRENEARAKEARP